LDVFFCDRHCAIPDVTQRTLDTPGAWACARQLPGAGAHGDRLKRHQDLTGAKPKVSCEQEKTGQRRAKSGRQIACALSKSQIILLKLNNSADECFVFNTRFKTRIMRPPSQRPSASSALKRFFQACCHCCVRFRKKTAVAPVPKPKRAAPLTGTDATAVRVAADLMHEAFAQPLSDDTLRPFATAVMDTPLRLLGLERLLGTDHVIIRSTTTPLGGWQETTLKFGQWFAKLPHAEGLVVARELLNVAASGTCDRPRKRLRSRTGVVFTAQSVARKCFFDSLRKLGRGASGSAE
jgi:hypothetical protein